MRLHAMREILGISALVLAVSGAPATSWGQPAVLDDEEPAVDEDKSADADDIGDSVVGEPLETQYGVAFRLRNVRLPKSLIEAFVESVPAGISSVGFGVEFVRRKGDFEISLGIEYESLNGKDGLWLDKGDTIPQDEVDLVQFEDFAWTSADVTFVWHSPVHEKFAIRYGAGIGLALMMGEVLRTDYVCGSDVLAQPPEGQCVQKPNAENIRAPEDKIPPVFPILNLLVGGQFRPVKQAAINFEIGFRSLPYFGTSVSYFF